jgi:hypothetical protein
MVGGHLNWQQKPWQKPWHNSQCYCISLNVPASHGVLMCITYHFLSSYQLVATITMPTLFQHVIWDIIDLLVSPCSISRNPFEFTVLYYFRTPANPLGAFIPKPLNFEIFWNYVWSRSLNFGPPDPKCYLPLTAKFWGPTVMYGANPFWNYLCLIPITEFWASRPKMLLTIDCQILGSYNHVWCKSSLKTGSAKNFAVVALDHFCPNSTYSVLNHTLTLVTQFYVQ